MSTFKSKGTCGHAEFTLKIPFWQYLMISQFELCG